MCLSVSVSVFVCVCVPENLYPCVMWKGLRGNVSIEINLFYSLCYALWRLSTCLAARGVAAFQKGFVLNQLPSTNDFQPQYLTIVSCICSVLYVACLFPMTGLSCVFSYLVVVVRSKGRCPHGSHPS